ncbi:hypothetical protein ARC78_06445 [Stenotrophomonas pictorum JCM 9942]|uniref:Uncharacterized protein n=1 Tax=Stenotrophomonas pictorum JCM 9942 TaxID=1236960 RepID=A0A0R0AFX4_9GAMM|nr:hypothetical protein [Stenotrophomonas pictorum]KRG43958.1 hypothetical protein ARC78_06445 [Stenotrophomonas pictorum JCM 9942]
MKVQIHRQSIRLRIDEAELARLLAGQRVENHTRLAAERCWSQTLRLVPSGEVLITGDTAILQISLPRDAVLALQARLPCRDGLSFDVAAGGEPLQLRLDVDIRDSLRQRGPSRRSAAATSSMV